MEARERLFLTADSARLVREGHPDAATLYAGEGHIIPDAAAETFGLVDGKLPDGYDDDGGEAAAARLAAEKAQAEKEAAEKAEADRLAAEKAEADRIAADKAEADKAAAEKAEAETAKTDGKTRGTGKTASSNDAGQTV